MTQSNRIFLTSFIQQYVDETAYLCCYRKQSSSSSNEKLDKVLEYHSRLEANIDGLLLSGEPAWHLCKENLELEDPDEFFTAAVFAIGTSDQEKLDEVFELAGDNIELLDAIADALSWFPLEQSQSILDNDINSNNILRVYTAMYALTSHRAITPRLQLALSEALRSDHLPLIRQALVSIGELGLAHYLPKLQGFIYHQDESIQFAAAWSASRFGDAQALQQLKTFVDHPQYFEKALHFVLTQQDLYATSEMIRQLISNKETIRHGIIAIGMLGNPSIIPQLLEFMNTAETARIAADAFCNITGLDLEENKMDVDEPEGFEAGPNDDPEDENVDMDPDEDLPWPDVEKLINWWAQNQNQFPSGHLYICGKPKSKTQYENILRNGNQKQRAFAANCLGLLDPQTPIFNVYAPAKWQMQLLGISS